MDENEDAFYDYLRVRDTAVAAVAGQMLVDNIPRETLVEIMESTTNEIIRLAAKIVMYQRDPEGDRET